MRIEESWLYELSELEDNIEEIHIDKNIEVYIFDDTHQNVIVQLDEWAELHYFSYLSWEINENISSHKHIQTLWKWAKAYLNCINFSKNNKIQFEMFTQAIWNKTTLNTNILSFAWERGDLNIDWILKINEWTSENEWELDEENIFLWESGKISWIPTLYVWTNDMQASHACRMEKISDEKLFYLRSRGVWKENALSIMIESKIVSLFAELERINDELYKNITEKILQDIQW